MLTHPHNILAVGGVLPHELLQKGGLGQCEFLVNFSIPTDLDRNRLLCLVVNSRNNLGKTTFSKDFQHFKSVKDVVTGFHNVVAFFVVPALRLLFS